nr:hypothetical protein [Roseovarius sp. A-2]
MTKRDPFKYFETSREIICLAVMLYVRFPLSLRNVEDLLHGRGIDVSHETVRYWWHRFGPLFAAQVKMRRVHGLRFSRWLNNRAENSRLPFRRRERAMLRFRRVRSLQKFAAIHASVHNLVNSERSLYSRSNFKRNRAAALAEWRNLCTA